MGTVIKSIISSMISALFGGGGQDLSSFVRGTSEAFQAVGQLLQDELNVRFQEHGAVTFVQPLARQVGHDFEQIQGTQQAWVNRILDVILPHSFAHLVGFVYSDGIVPLRVDLRFVHSTLDGLLAWQSKIAAWVDNVAVPTLADYQNFKAFLLRNWAPPVNTLADWLANPGIFGAWAAAPITGPVIAYLANPAHAQSRDNLARIMVGAWTEVPNDVWELILQWSVT